MRTKGGTTAPFGHVIVGRLPPRRGPVSQPFVQEGDESAVAPRVVEVSDHQHVTGAAARTDWPTAASAADHSLQYWESGARVCARCRATGPPADHKVAFIMYGLVVPSQATVRT